MNVHQLVFVVSGVLLTASPPTDVVTSAQQPSRHDSPIVIIHGAWGGAHHWKSVGDSLIHDHARSVRRVSLTGLGERAHLVSKDINLTTHIQDVVSVINFDDLKKVTLIAHSYGGAIALGVVDAIPDRVAKVIMIDAHVLNNSECYLALHGDQREKLTQRADEAGDGWLIPVDWKNDVRDSPHPLATLVEPLALKHPAPTHIEFVYWLLADGKPAEEDERYVYLQRAKERGWSTKVLPWYHNPQRTRPHEVVSELLPALQ